jgi:hypothetical protein
MPEGKTLAGQSSAKLTDDHLLSRQALAAMQTPPVSMISGYKYA